MSERKTKKPYRPPRLVVHGTLRDLTRAMKGGASADGGGSPKTKATGKG
jgi:hypothetical protein